MTDREQLAEQIGGFVEAYTGYGREEGKCGWSADVRHTNRIVADVDSLIAEVIALAEADVRRRLLRPETIGAVGGYDPGARRVLSSALAAIGIDPEGESDEQ